MKKLSMETTEHQRTDIVIGKNLSRPIAAYLDNTSGSRNIFVTDETMRPILQKYLQPTPSDVFVSATGETHKTLADVQALLRFLHDHKISRNDRVISFGGGMISDIAGFAASIYNRGVQLACIPTSLLGMVDASIGGKNGVNFEGSKNIIGTIRNPNAVFIDPSLLKTLPDHELLSGLGELAKLAICYDKDLFELLQKPFRDTMEEAIFMAVRDKAHIVSEDPRETSSLRQLINFGHTLGHALESTTDFELPHGLAVAIGCNFAAFVSYREGRISNTDYATITAYLKQLKLPVFTEFKVDEVMKYIKDDKKKVGPNMMSFVLVDAIGRGTTEILEFSTIADYLKEFKATEQDTTP